MRRLRGVVVLAACAALVAACGAGPRRNSSAPTTTTTATPTTTTAPPAHTVPPSTVPTTTPPPFPPAFTWSATALDAATRALMTGNSWRPGCPVPLAGLRLVSLSYWGFDATAHTGQLVVDAGSVTAVVNAFRSLYTARFPVRRMRLVDYYGGDDERSMAADNTSAFNCRLVPGTTVWSQHAYGRAVDLDPLENPEIQDGQVDPPSAAPWADRNRTDPGMVRHGDAAWQAFAAVGWKWGGDWVSLQDYMHFSANGL